MRKSRPFRPLFGIVAVRVIAFGLLAMILQMGIVMGEYYFDGSELARLMVEREAAALAQGLSASGAGAAYALPAGLERYGQKNKGYFVRIRTSPDKILYSNCNEQCEEHFLPVTFRPPDFWQSELAPGKPISVAGGRTVIAGGERVLIELAVIGDRAGRMWAILLHELADHMVWPMSLMLVFVLGATLLSVRHALRPVNQAALQAHGLDPLNTQSKLALQGMPAEIAELGRAINGALDRIAGLIQAQKVFTSAVAHEIRTPLAAIQLTLGKIDDPRARQAEADMRQLSRFVDQMTALARLEANGAGKMENLALASLCKARVSTLAGWVYANAHSIEFLDYGGAPVACARLLVEDAIGNLIENAVRHTPPGTHIRVEAGPGPTVTVRDSADGAGTKRPQPPAQRGGGIGLQIVQRIAALLAADFSLTSTNGETVARLAFRQAAP